MFRQYQSVIRHKPSEGRYGDCMRTCVACLLDLHWWDVPNCAEGLSDSCGDSSEIFHLRMESWLSRRGLTYIGIPISAPTWEVAARLAESFMRGRRWIMVGGSRVENINHAVCMKDGGIEWNPSPISSLKHPCWPDREEFWAYLLLAKV